MNAALDVSRETRGRLEGLLALLERWNRTINLVAPSTVSDAWSRHVVDSAQLHTLAPKADLWVDLGSGAGFPGLVVAILAMEAGTPGRTILIESDLRKAAFLQTACRELDIPAKVIAARAETAEPQGADIVSARALAPLDRLLGLVQRHLAPGGRAFLPKGATYRKELDSAQRAWAFTRVVHPSRTDPAAVILEVGGLRRA
ncbi:MAG: 16S rRNA (guanine(527)-N(7))-methyltransferase RsmG [Rhodobacteraceae bacterium]|nr:16S rRNA (guanine(527)-N(7))-methyltransferase RsmG [Paracoccaceae bacterium]